MSLEDIVTERYLVTAAQHGARPHKGFERSLNAYATDIGAQVVVAPINGAYIDEPLHPSIANNPDYTVTNSMGFNKNLELIDFPIRAQQIIPTTGLGRFIQHNKSAVLASPKVALECLATSNIELPKILATTGALTQPNYKTQTRIGQIAQRDHQYGALLIEVDGDLFQYRQIIADTSGTFYDIDRRVDGKTGKISKSNPDAIVFGDIHTAQINPAVHLTNLEMMRDLKPRAVVLHDIYDGSSISHHNVNQLMQRTMKADLRGLNLSDELYQVGALLHEYYNELGSKSEIVVVKSNHDEVLDRYLEEGRFINDPENFRLAANLAIAKLDGEDTLQAGIEGVYGSFGKYVRFLGRDEDYKVRGIQLGAHGDLGGNGSRGGKRQQQNNYGPSITAHTHTPHILNDAWCVGTSTNLKMDYNRGPSSWMNTHALVHPNGKRQLINVIDSRYRFND